MLSVIIFIIVATQQRLSQLVHQRITIIRSFRTRI